MIMSETLHCPRCEKPFLPEAPGVSMPFCSARCKLADLNGWLSEDYSLPMDIEAEEEPEHEA